MSVGNAGTGFRFGLPVIEPVYYDAAKRRFSYMMVTTDGSRIQFRQNKAGDGYPTTITQTWKNSNGQSGDTTHTWATLSYTTQSVSTSFDSSLAISGPLNGTQIKVLDKVTYADSSYTKFVYNGYIQVQTVENRAANTNFLNSTTTNLTTDGLDCPRFTQTQTVAQNFNNGNPVAVTNTAPIPSTYSVGGMSGSAALIEVAVGVQLLRVLAFSGLFISVALTYTGGLQGTGDTKSPLYISIISQVAIPLGICFAIQRFGTLEPIHIWLAILSGHIVRCALSVTRFLQGKWRNIAVDIERTAA